MGDILQNAFGGQTDNPFQVPAPTMQEILFRTLASSLPPPGKLQVPNTIGGRLLGTGARLAGGLAGVMGTELERQRLDELTRKYEMNKRFAGELQGAFKQPEDVPALPTPPIGNIETIPGTTTTPADYRDQEQGPLFVPPTTPQRFQPPPAARRPSTTTHPFLDKLSQSALAMGFTTDRLKPSEMVMSPVEQAQIESSQSTTEFRQAQTGTERFNLQRAQERAQRDNAFITAL